MLIQVHSVKIKISKGYMRVRESDKELTNKKTEEPKQFLFIICNKSSL